MPTTGAYEFRPVNQFALIVGDITSPDMLPPGTWAWVDRSEELGEPFLELNICCPDCRGLGSLGYRRADKPWVGHGIDPYGNVTPSVLHTWKMNGVEQCGFHTQPTKLVGFVERR